MPIAFDIRELDVNDNYTYEVRVKHGDGTTEVLAEGKGVFASLIGSTNDNVAGKQVIDFDNDDLSPQVVMSSILALHNHLEFMLKYIAKGMDHIEFDPYQDDWSKVIDLAIASLTAYTDLKCPGQVPVSQMEKGDLN